MNVYAYWDSSESPIDEQAGLLRVWERSWRRQGWTPRLLTIANARKSKNYQPSNNSLDNMLWALHAVGGGWLSDIRLINNSLKPFKPRHGYTVDPWTLIYMDRRSVAILTNPETCGRLALHRFDLGDSAKYVNSFKEAIEICH